MYSHDTFGLGHLRRSRTIAHALAARFPEMEISIISGSPVIDAFSFEDRVSYVQLPPALKLANGEYTSGAGDQTVEQTIDAREAVIAEAARRIAPDMVIVDKEPLGLAREMLPTLQWLKSRGAITILGLRDVLDAPELLREEWDRKHVTDYLEDIYDELWIYGPRSFHDPLAGIDLTDEVRSRTRYTGFLPRDLPDDDGGATATFGKGYVLVTAGGGGDGYDLMAAAIEAAWETEARDLDFLFVLGPFMTERQRQQVTARAAGLPNVRVAYFHAHLETLVANARAVVGMCGYNTFCEVVSFDRPALFVPRTAPRREQSIRAHRASDFGWVDVLDIETARDPKVFLAAIRGLIGRKTPSQAAHLPDLGGLERICALTEAHIAAYRRASEQAGSLKAAQS